MSNDPQLERRAGRTRDEWGALIDKGDRVEARDLVWEALAPLSDQVPEGLPSLEAAARRTRLFLTTAPPGDVLVTVARGSLFRSLLREDVEALCSRAPKQHLFPWDFEGGVRAELNEIREYLGLPEGVSAADVSAAAERAITSGDSSSEG